MKTSNTCTRLNVNFKTFYNHYTLSPFLPCYYGRKNRDPFGIGIDKIKYVSLRL